MYKDVKFQKGVTTVRADSALQLHFH